MISSVTRQNDGVADALLVHVTYDRRMDRMMQWWNVRRISMKMVRMIIQLPQPLKAKLKAEQRRGTSAAGLIRHLLEQHFKGKKAA